MTRRDRHSRVRLAETSFCATAPTNDDVAEQPTHAHGDVYTFGAAAHHQGSQTNTNPAAPVDGIARGSPKPLASYKVFTNRAGRASPAEGTTILGWPACSSCTVDSGRRRSRVCEVVDAAFEKLGV
jgi:hypothetical protein